MRVLVVLVVLLALSQGLKDYRRGFLEAMSRFAKEDGIPMLGYGDPVGTVLDLSNSIKLQS